MTSSVRPWPNYYEVLGLSPGASEEQIGKAFARGMGMFGAHPVTAAAQISAAFETLRNPLKRRAYDEALGLTQRPEPKPRQWSMAIPAQTTRGFDASVPGGTAKATTGPVAAKSLERLARLAEAKPLAEPMPEIEGKDESEGEAGPERPMCDRRMKPPEAGALAAVGVNIPNGEVRPVEWKRPLLAMGGLILAAGLIGALAGSSVLGSEQAPPSAPRPLVGRPAAKAQAIMTAPVTAAVVQPMEAASAPARTQRRRAIRRPVRLAEASADVSSPTGSTGTAPTDSSTAPPAAQSGSDRPSPALDTIAATGLPLAAGVMARTIERIGYACGSIASASPADGAGIYKVTCTSGDVYRAAPVNGRYRFKRWSTPRPQNG